MKAKILVLCTGNSCRSQMAEGILKSFDNELEVYSAGVSPASIIQPNTFKVMEEINIDISKNYPKDVKIFSNESFDYVITVCDNAKETCPIFLGVVKNRIHISFDDPSHAKGTEEEKLNSYRKVRDEIKTEFKEFYNSKIMKG
jgi:arsenate reductase (thioredoxin)